MEEKIEKRRRENEVILHQKDSVLEKNQNQQSKVDDDQGNGKLPSTENRKPESSTELKLKKKKALLEFSCMIEDAIHGNYIVEKTNKNNTGTSQVIHNSTNRTRDITLWGVPLLPSTGHPGTSTVLLKFLKAKDYRVLEAFEMLRKTLKWRRQYKTDSILEEDLDLEDLNKVDYLNSTDKQGHPLFYNVCGAFKDKELYSKVLGSEDKREKFLRWRIQFMEKCIKKLTFRQGEADSIVQITDLKNSPGPEMKELRSMAKNIFMLLQANYPHIIHKHILINVPFWYYTSRILSSKLTKQTTRKKLIFARPSRVTQTLLKYISIEHLPIQYGGLKRENDVEFLPEDKVSELTLRANTSSCIKIPVPEGGVTMVWEFTVVGWDHTSYEEEFIPEDEGSYRILLTQNQKKIGECVRNSFYISEPGHIFISIANSTIKKKMVFYRFNSKPTPPMYIILKK